MRYFFIDPSLATKPSAEIRGSEAHHIKNVLRLRPGDGIKLFDGKGFEYEAVIVNMVTNKVDVRIQCRCRADINCETEITVAQAFLKEKKMDDLVRKICELGAAGWLPFFSQRSIARPDEKRLAGRTRRWERIATEALKQCRRVDTPKIGQALSYKDVLNFGKSCDLKIVFWENESNPLARNIQSGSEYQPKKILVMLGPEGGFTRQEIKLAEDNGFVIAGLGPRILRAETATIAAFTLVQYLYGDMGPKVDQPKSNQKNLDKNKEI